MPCDREAVRDANAILAFCEDLVATIGMAAYGEPVLAHFATHLPEAAGYSLVQLIETSAVTGHFCDASGDAYLAIFGVLAFRAPPEEDEAVESVADPFAMIAQTVGVSLFNPHAVLETVGILGGAIVAQTAENRIEFAAGVISASWVWFVIVGLGVTEAAHRVREALDAAKLGRGHAGPCGCPGHQARVGGTLQALSPRFSARFDL